MNKKLQTNDLTVIVGAMFSGKSSTLSEFITRYEIAGVKTQVFKPLIDDRGEGKNSLRTHSNNEISAIAVKNSNEILKEILSATAVVGIDEAQFFDMAIIGVVSELLNEKKMKVLVAGLPADFRGEPFGAMPQLLSLADDIIHCKAVCTFFEDGGICGEEATKTQRLIDGKPAKYSDPVVQVGGQELYEARCVKHHFVPGKKI